VTWSSSDATVAKVGTDGTVTGLKAGTVSITAASHKDPSVKGAAAITVGGGGTGGPVTVLVSSITKGGAPVQLDSVAGQIDVNLDVDAAGQQLKSVQATLTCGSKSMTRTQTISGAAPAATDAAEAQAPVTLSFPTAEFNATTGAPTLTNGACTIAASATTASGTQSATNSQPITLKNPDAVILTTTTNGNSAADVNGLPWKSGAVTVSALPILYSGRTPATVTITLPGAPSGASQTVTAATSGATTATWSNTSGSGSSVRNATIIGGYGANGFPLGVHPTVLVIDSQGNDLTLNQANATSQSDVRIDNGAPAAAAVFTIPTPVSSTNLTGMNGWVNAAYTFTGSASRYTSGGDAGVSNGSGVGTPGSNVTTPEPAVNVGVSSNTGLNGQTTFTYWAAPAADFTALSGGSSTGTGCSTTGLTQITTAGDLAATLVNTAYRVRALEMDKLGNVRCTDLGQPGGQTTFGVDKVAPTAAFADPPAGSSAADLTAVNAANPAIPSFQLVISDDASGFTSTPSLTTVTRNYPNLTSAQKCVVGTLASSGACNTASTTTTVPVNGSGAAAAGTEGYYVYTSTVRDQAQNAAPTLSRQAVVDVTAPTMGGVSIPASIPGGASATFATSATDNLDLVSSNYTLTYGTNIPNPPAATTGLPIRAQGPSLGTAFDATLTTSASFSVTVAQFLRNIQVTDASGVPQALSAANQPSSLTVRAVDAAGNSGASAPAAIPGANVPQTGATNYSTLTGFSTWTVANAATNICNASPCATSGMATSVTLSAQAAGTLSTFQVPFQQVQFYYFDTGVGEWVFIGTATGSTVTDNAGTRTFTWTMSFDPPASLGTAGALNVIAIGVNSNGDGLATPNNGNITLNP